jgi:hypothetical protein
MALLHKQVEARRLACACRLDGIAIRHTDVGHMVQGALTDEQLCALSRKRTCTHPITEDRFDPKHGCLKPSDNDDSHLSASKRPVLSAGYTAGSHHVPTVGRVHYHAARCARGVLAGLPLVPGVD